MGMKMADTEGSVLERTITSDDLYRMVAPEIPCEYVSPIGKECPNEAVWIIHLRPHGCTISSGEPSHRLVCDDCLTRIKSGDLWRCRRCGGSERIRKYITRIEPLK